MCPAASFLATGRFKFLIGPKCMHGLLKHAVVAAICIYAKHSEDAAKRGSWRPCIK